MGKPDIIYEDNDIIVCYKPAGIATQTRRIGQQDMESFIRNYRAAKNEPLYVGIVHRLDILSDQADKGQHSGSYESGLLKNRAGKGNV